MTRSARSNFFDVNWRKTDKFRIIFTPKAKLLEEGGLGGRVTPFADKHGPSHMLTAAQT